MTVVGNDGMLAHGSATDITREILNDVFARANRLGVSVPVFMPETAWQGMIELGIGLSKRLLHEDAHLDREKARKATLWRE